MPNGLAWQASAVAQGLATADAVVAPSRNFAAALWTHYGSARPVLTVYNARRTKASRATRSGHAFTAGRLWDPGNNAAVMDAAAQQLQIPFPAAGPVIGPHGDTMSLQHLRLLGELDADAMAEQLACAAIFVSLALYEPFGLAVLEAA